jgi:predicted amidohydrolase
MSTLKVAIIQMQSNEDIIINIQKAEQYIKEAALNEAKIIVLPEFFIYIGDSSSDIFLSIVEEIGIGKIQQQIAKWASLYKVYIVAGTLPIRSNGHKIFNTTIVYNDFGDMVAIYNKIHLFKFKCEDNTSYDEGEMFQSGSDIVNFNIDNFSFGLAICYDLRFPELFRELSGVDAIIIPAAFMEETGRAHWEILLRARAIENQCYVVAAGQCGVHNNGRKSYGHSMIIDPWGKVLNNPNNVEGIIYDVLDSENIKIIRTKLPALYNKKI